MKKLLNAALGREPCDLVIKGGRIANVLSLEYERADVAVSGGIIVGVGSGYTGLEERDASGQVVIPGMIDGHLHIESTMLPPAAFASLVVPFGTTTVMPDPHEIANTCGLEGIEFMWRESLKAPLDVCYGAPSCVPASPFETPREALDAVALGTCRDRGWCTHLGEMMNYPGVIGGDPETWSKIAAFRDVVRTAHAPGVTGAELCAYLLSCCDADHESSSRDEAVEKLRRGMWVMLRQGAAEHNLQELAKIIVEDEARYARCLAVSDDLSASHIAKCGHMDHKVRLLIEAGVRPLVALALVTINPADYFRLHDRGAIAPGRIADIAIVDSLESCRAVSVYKRGKLVAQNGSPLFTAAPPATDELPKLPPLAIVPDISLFKVPATRESGIRVMEVLPNQVVTNQLTVPPKIENDSIVSDGERDIIKLAVVEKNTGSGRTGLGFARGFGLSRGALGSSVAHDAHNYIILGADDESMLTALRYLVDNNGGQVAAVGREIVSCLSLPIGGLMSDLDAGSLTAVQDRLAAAAKELGVTLPHPFMALSFLSLSVIPQLKLTDRGYINLSEGGVVL